MRRRVWRDPGPFWGGPGPGAGVDGRRRFAGDGPLIRAGPAWAAAGVVFFQFRHQGSGNPL